MNEQNEQMRGAIINVLKKHDVKRASLFGSYVRGEETPESDIDILVEFKGRKSLLDLVGLNIELEDRLGKKFDVITYNSLHPLLKDRILGEQKPIL